MPGPNPPSNVSVRYTPGNTKPWSQLPAPKIHVSPGSTVITWTIMVIPASAGAIIFNTNSLTPGIDFTEKGTAIWPGSDPTGDAIQWSSTIDNALPRGSNAIAYPYVVNALFTPTNGTQVPVQYDPDVEEDPPHVVMTP